MPTSARQKYELPADYFWRIRKRELAHKVQLTREAVDRATEHQRCLVLMWDTAFTNQLDWKEATDLATAAVRQARAHRTSLRKMVLHLKDTLKIRPNLASECPESMKDAIEMASRLCDYMDAHGF